MSTSTGATAVAAAAAASTAMTTANDSGAASSSSLVAPAAARPAVVAQQYLIRGVSVEFPYPAYECQQVYMEKVIQAVQLSQHALLESPTGTGKTLCLLCAALAWRNTYVANLDLAQCPPSALLSSLSSRLQLAAFGIESVGGASAPVPPRPSGLPSMSIPTADPTSSMDGLRGLYGLGVTQGGNGPGAAGGSGKLPSSASALGSAFGVAVGTNARPKIIYSSRTHSQLAKVASELKHTRYRPKMTILGSRQQLCVHPVVSKLEGAGQTHACRALTADKACNYYEHLPTWTSENPHLQNQVLDIEDLMVMGREQHMCPYFYSRDRMADAELVLLPYNYLIDTSIRNRLGLQFDNAILIFDEAHNLEGVCGDSASFDLSEADLAQAIQEVQRCIDMMRDPQSTAIEEMAAASGGAVDAPDLPSLAILKAILLEFEQLLDRQPLPDNGEGFTQPGEFIFQLLRQCKIEYGNKDMLLDLLDKSVQLLFSDRADSQRKACALDKFATAIKIIFKGGEQGCVSAASYYRVHIHTKDPPAQSNQHNSNRVQKGIFGDAPKKTTQSVGRILSYWCFNPGVAMQDLTHVGVRCMLLTSGTLSPMESFAHELKLPFPIRLENPHVITPEQIWVGVMERGPAGVTLNSGFKSRENVDYVNDLGNALVNMSRVVPDGLLVFFPSYAVLSSCSAAWKQSGPGGKPSILEAIQSKKALVVEPRTSAEFASAIADFEAKLDDPAYKGAVFFAVCRGKVSEGLDFADRAGRAVIVTGLPYPAYKDPKVRLKRLYLDESPRIPGLRQLSGQEWYNQQAARAINQAIGRVIRHRGDYGAVILADARFSQPAVRAQLSRWIRPFVHNFPQFGAFAGGVARFFVHASKAFPTSTKVAKDESAEAERHRSTSGGASSSSSSSAALRQAGASGRSGGAWSVSSAASSSLATPGTINAAPTFHASRAALQAQRQSGDDWLESFSALQGGLESDAADAAGAKGAPAPASHADASGGGIVHRNATLLAPKRAHPTSLLLSLLNPAHAATHGNGKVNSVQQAASATTSAAAVSAATTARPAPSASAMQQNRLLRLSTFSSSVSSSGAGGRASSPIKIELETDHSEPSASFADQLASASQVATRVQVKTEPRSSVPPPPPSLSQSLQSRPVAPASTPAVASAKAANGGATASDSIKALIKRVKQALTPGAFAQLKTALGKMTTLKDSESTSDNFFQRAAEVKASVQLLVSLLFGFEKDVLEEEDGDGDGGGGGSRALQWRTSPPRLDDSLAVLFARQVPGPFRMHYSKALERMRTRWPATRTNTDSEVTATATSTLPLAPSVKLERASPAPSSATLSRAASIPASGAAAAPVKRERPSDQQAAASSSAAAAAASAASASSSSSSLPPPATQQAFVGAVKARLDSSSYSRFRLLILSLESADHAPLRLPLAQLFAELHSVLDSPSLMHAYANLMPQRLRPAYQQFLASKQAVAGLKWTTPDDGKTASSSSSSFAAAAAAAQQQHASKRPKLDIHAGIDGSGAPSLPNQPPPNSYTHKTIRRPQ